MSGWTIFFIILFVLGFIFSHLLLLKQTAKTKIPDHILKKIAERKEKEAQLDDLKKQQKEKPTDK